MRILFTGGSGKAGRHAITYLLAQGHRVVNVDVTPLDLPGVDNRLADMTDAGQMHDVMHAWAGYDEMEDHPSPPGFDAVVHFAAIPRLLMKSDNECYRINTIGTYNVIDAALKAGIRKVVFASSETTYGVCFAAGARKPLYLPVDEEHPVVPEDSYAMSKVANEVTAQCFQRRTGADIYGLRINNVVEPHEYKANFPAYMADPDLRRRNIFAYIDARDLGQMVERCLQTDGLGFQIFNVANRDHSVNLTTAEIIERYYQDIPAAEMAPHETFYSIRKAEEMLGFAPEHNWRMYLDDPGEA
ncbi:MAG: nucleoside-diphosphate-sugar epimerase [Alphaproteobacteria bacterium MedPE-SWcel]|nr:MAG: nucleoside-diphosphate-sugar epimerase [Alphaproteobacteria bacterium MedPE-SWcel]